MAVFGGYETVRELYRSGLASASTARKVGGDGGDRFVVKCYRPPSVDGSDDLIQREVETFLDGARAQQKAAASGAEHWAAVHEVGTVEGGAYFVTDNHRRSVQHLIRGHVRLRGGGLYRIVGAVVHGLIEFRRACDRPHGNLKPSNILLAGKSDISQATPLLTDPAGAGHLDPKTGDVPDLHAVGELIYQLVLLRTGKAMGGYPAPDSKEWAALGKNGTAWRQLCNRLLNPNLSPGLLTFEDLAEDVEKLRERVGKPWTMIAAAAAVLALVAVGALVLWPPGDSRRNGNGAKIEVADLIALCQEYHGWVEPLMLQREQGHLASWEKDSHLSQRVLPVLAGIMKNTGDFAPRKIIGYSGRSDYLLEGLRSDPDELLRGLEEAKKREAGSKVAEALAAVKQLKRDLSSEAWPALGQSAAKAKTFKDRGWQAPAEYLAGLVPFAGSRVKERVDSILAAQQPLAEIEEKWKSIEKLREELETWGQGDVKPLARFGEYLLSETAVSSDVTGAKSLQKVVEKLDDLLAPNGLPQRLKDYIHRPKPPAKPLYWSLVEKEPPFAVAAGEKMTDDVLRKGLARLASGHYDVRDDPRTAEWKGQIEDALRNRGADVQNLQQRIRNLRNQLAKAELSPDSGKKITEGLDAVDQARKEYPESLRATRDTYAKVIAAAVYDPDSHAEIDAGIARVGSALKDIAGRISSGMERIRELEGTFDREVRGTLEQVRERLRARSTIVTSGAAQIDAEINRIWVTQRDELLKSETKAKALAEKADRLSSFLVGIPRQFTAEPVVKAGDERPWNVALVTTEVKSRRRHAVSSCLSFANWQKVLPGQEDPSFTQNRDHQISAYNTWRAGLSKIVPAFNRIQDALNAGYLLTEKPGSLSVTLGEFHAEQQKDPVLRDPAVSKAVQAMVARLDALKQVAALTDPQRLLAQVNAGRQGSFESARAAWLRLGRLSRPWPSSPAELKQEIEARKNLSALYGLLSDATRKAALQQELAVESPGRWEAYFVNVSGVGQIEDAVGQMAQFGVKPDGQLPPLARFRLDMYAFRRDVSAQPGKLPDAQVKQIIGDFLAKLQSMPGAFRQRSDVLGMTGELGKIQKEPGGGGVDLTKAGPAGLGHWRIARQTADTVTYSWEWQPGKTEELTFRKVTTTGGKRCFLCTTETPVDLFRKVVAKNWQDVNALLVPDDDAYGPRVWVRSGGELAVSARWLHNVHSMIDEVKLRRYAEAAKPSEMPTGAHPMQHVSLAGAIYFCRLMNCRLPTSAEWLAALQANKAASPEKPNLRDETWRIQRDHMISLEENDGVPVEWNYPYAGIFSPRGIAVKKKREALPVSGAGNDKHLWFAKVDTGGQAAFQHLVGNVAEFTYEDPDEFQNTKGGSAVTTGEVMKLAKAAKVAARVIGGSALSAPEVARDKPQELPEPRSDEDPKQAFSFSDVGFRLAFLAGPGRLQDRVLNLLKGIASGGYLSPTP